MSKRLEGLSTRPNAVLFALGIDVFEHYFATFSKVINAKLGTHFLIVPINTKLAVHQDIEQITLYVTDLANSLYDHYVEKTETVFDEARAALHAAP